MKLQCDEISNRGSNLSDLRDDYRKLKQKYNQLKQKYVSLTTENDFYNQAITLFLTL